MTKIQQLHAEHGQSPWLDNLTRGRLRSGALRRLIDDGIRGVTSNPTIFAKAIGGSPSTTTSTAISRDAAPQPTTRPGPSSSTTSRRR